MKIFFRVGFTIFILATISLNLQGANISWTNSIGGDWNNAANWDSNAVPGAADTAIINVPGVTVFLSSYTAVGGITLGGSSGTVTLAPSNQTLVVNGPLTINPGGSFTLDSGVLSGNVTISGTVNWTGGIFGLNNDALTIATNGAVILSGTSGTTYTIAEAVTNEGVFIIQSGNVLVSYCNGGQWGQFDNVAGGLVDMKTDSSIGADGCSPGFFNEGTVRKSSGTGTNVIVGNFVNDGGTLAALTGTIQLTGGTVGGVLSAANGAALLLSSNTIVLSGSLISSNATLAGATLTGYGTISGILNWTDGTFGLFNTALTIATNGTVILMGTNGGNYIIAETVTNAGIFRIQSGNVLVSYCNSGQWGQFDNVPGGLVDMSADSSIGTDGCSPGFFNEGTVRKSGGTGTNVIVGNFVNDGGTVAALTGTIQLVNGMINGVLSAANGAALLLSSNMITLNGSLVSSNATLAGATLIGNGVISGTLNWTDGTFGYNNNVFTIATNGTVILNGTNGGTYTIAEVVTNAGIFRVLSGNVTVAYCGSGHYGQFDNAAGGLIDLINDGSFGVDDCSPGFFNEGTVRKSGGTGISTITGNIVNDGGTIEARSGVITFNTFANSTSKILVANGATIQFPQALSSPVSITGSGTVQTPSITSSGTVDPGATNAVLNLIGNYTQMNDGRMYVEIGGTTPGVNQSQVNITGTAQLNGLIGLNLSPGYVPAVNSSNVILTATSTSGKFAFQNGFYLLGQNKRFQPAYNPNNLVVTVISAPDPTNVPVNVSYQSQRFLVAWPSEFSNYNLYVTTNLIDPVWTIIPGVSNLYEEYPATSPQKFFRLF